MNPDVSDEHLVELAQAGERDAFLTLYNRYLKKVHNRVKSRVPHRDAEDVTQEIFVAVVRSIDRFEGRSRFNTWLYTIVNRQIADYYRRHYRRSDNLTMSLEDATELDVSEENTNMDEWVAIQEAMADIPENYQEVILMRFADGLTFSEIADQTNRSLEATKSLYRRAIRAVTEKVDRL